LASLRNNFGGFSKHIAWLLANSSAIIVEIEDFTLSNTEVRFLCFIVLSTVPSLHCSFLELTFASNRNFQLLEN
jgi:hypothetical protein